MAHNLDNGKLTYLYRLEEGQCTNSFGLNVAILAGLPEKVIDKGREKSKLINS